MRGELVGRDRPIDAAVRDQRDGRGTGRRRGEPTDRLGQDFVGGERAVDGDDVGLVGLGSFERVELARHHVGAHVVALAVERPVACGRLVECEVDESHVTRVAEQIAVAASQRRAGDDHVAGGAQLLADPGEPGPPIGVGQRMTRRHLGDVGG